MSLKTLMQAVIDNRENNNGNESNYTGQRQPLETQNTLSAKNPRHTKYIKIYQPKPNDLILHVHPNGKKYSAKIVLCSNSFCTIEYLDNTRNEVPLYQIIKYEVDSTKNKNEDDKKMVSNYDSTTISKHIPVPPRHKKSGIMSPLIKQNSRRIYNPNSGGKQKPKNQRKSRRNKKYNKSKKQ